MNVRPRYDGRQLMTGAVLVMGAIIMVLLSWAGQWLWALWGRNWPRVTGSILSSVALLALLGAPILFVPSLVRERNRRTAFVVLLGVWVLAAALWWTLPRLTNDAAMALYLRRHRGAFDHLVTMAETDAARSPVGEFGVARDPWRGRDSLAASSNPERYREYVHLFREIGLPAGFVVEDGRVIALMEDHGWAGGSDAKGYAYSSRPLRPLLPELGDRCGPDRTFIYRHLTGSWYLFRYCS